MLAPSAVVANIRLATVADVKGATALTRAHYAGYGARRGDRQLDADWPAYETLEDHGRLFVIGVFGAEDELVGYAMVHCGAQLQDRVVEASVDSIYVAPAHRHGGVGDALMRAVDEEAKRRGANDGVLYGVPVGCELDRLLGIKAKRGAAKRVENVYRVGA